METRKCQVIVDDKECGLDLEQEHAATPLVAAYRCALGHRTHIVTTKHPKYPRGGRIRDRKKAN